MLQFSLQGTGTLILLLTLISLELIDGFKFTLLHTNDMHARYDPISGNGGKCKSGDNASGLCYGGFGRVAAA